MINTLSKELSFEQIGRNGKVIWSYAKKMCKSELDELLPYINALEYEPYRDIRDSMEDEGFCGYRDEYSLHFIGFTDSYLPLFWHDMTLLYRGKYIRPYEKLYQYLLKKYFSGKNFQDAGVV